MTDWDRRFLELAQHVASWSKDPSTQVGAVIVDPAHRVVSLGFNGFPQRVADDSRLDDQETKYPIIIHAEMNAILFARRDLTGCTVYTWPFMPCTRCASVIIQVGISRVVAGYRETLYWGPDFQKARGLFQEAGVYLLEQAL